jgi:uncharacterized protein (DUF885 family)
MRNGPDFQTRVEEAVTKQVYPAYRKLIDYFNGVLPKTTTDDGVWKLPDGEAFYAYMLRKSTTTTLKPEEVHDLGLREVARMKRRCAQFLMRMVLPVSRLAKQWRD